MQAYAQAAPVGDHAATTAVPDIPVRPLLSGWPPLIAIGLVLTLAAAFAFLVHARRK